MRGADVACAANRAVRETATRANLMRSAPSLRAELRSITPVRSVGSLAGEGKGAPHCPALKPSLFGALAGAGYPARFRHF